MTLHNDDGPTPPDGGVPPRLHAVPPPPYDDYTGEPPYDPEYDAPPEPHDRPSRGSTPPNDRAAETAVLAALLADPHAHQRITGILQPTDFYQPAHEQIWDAYHHLLTQLDTSPDRVLLARHLLETKQHEALRVLTDLHIDEAQPQLVEHHAEIVRGTARRRSILTTADKLHQIGTTGDPADIHPALLAGLDTLEEAFRRDAANTTHTPASTWAALDLEEVLAGREVDPPPALLHRTDDQACLLYAGAVHTFSGEPGSGKTWVTLIAALQQIQAGQTVTMIDFEDRASRVVARLLALGATIPQVRDLFRYVRPHNALDTTDRTHLDAACTGSTLVILDGVTEAMTLHGLDLSSNPDVARFYTLLPRHIADSTGAAVVLIDHVVKDGEKQGRWGIGGQHKLAGIDGVAYLVKAIEKFGRGKIGHARIAVSKDRPGYIEEIAVGMTVAELVLDARDVNVLRHTLKTPQDVTTDEAGNMRPTHLMERISRYVEANPGLSKTELIDGRIRGKGTYLKRAIDRLIQESYIEVATGANRKQAHRSLTPFREDEEEDLA